MANYYFVTTFLPQLKLGVQPEITPTELDFLLRLNLTDRDYKKLSTLRRFVDIENIRRFLQGAPIEPGGNNDEKEIEENLLHNEGYPSYIFDFMERYNNTKTRLQHFSELLHEFFAYERKKTHGFIHNLLVFEWQWRLTFVALRAKALKRNLAEELSFEDPDDPFVENILDQQDSATFTPSEQYKELQTIFDKWKDNPLELNTAIAEWRFNKIEEMAGDYPFSIERVLAYVAQYEIIQEELTLNKQKGLEIVEQIATGSS